MSATIYLVRHASPDWERSDLPYHLPPGPPLTETGRLEAAELGDFLDSCGVERLFSSPLERCLHTAQIAAQSNQKPVQVLDELREWQPGEARSAVQERMLQAVDTVLNFGRDSSPCALVTHGGPIAALLLALGMDETRLETLRLFDHRNPLPPAGAWLARRTTVGQGWMLKLIYPPENQDQLSIDQG